MKKLFLLFRFKLGLFSSFSSHFFYSFHNKHLIMALDKGGSPSSAQVYFFLVLINVSFSGYHLISEYAMDNLDPIVFTFIRILLASVFLMGVLSTRENFTVERKKDRFLLFVLGLLSSAVNLTFIVGLYYSTAVIAGTIALLQPPATFALSVICGKERFTALKGLGSTISVAGGILIVVFGNDSSDEPRNIYLGGIFLLLNAAIFAFYILLQAELTTRMSPLKVQSLSFSMGMCLLLVSLMIQVWYNESADKLTYLWEDATLSDWGAIAYGVGISCFNFFGLAYCAKHASPTIAAGLNPLQPITSLIILAIFFGEDPNMGEILCCVITIFGLWLMLYGRYKETLEMAAKPPSLKEVVPYVENEPAPATADESEMKEVKPSREKPSPATTTDESERKEEEEGKEEVVLGEPPLEPTLATIVNDKELKRSDNSLCA